MPADDRNCTGHFGVDAFCLALHGADLHIRSGAWSAQHCKMCIRDRDGKVSCHYCDSVGFTQIPGFLPENPLKNAEMALEDDYGMIDGIINNGAKEPTVAELEQQARSGQPISLMELAAATHREEREKKKSVMEQLKGQPKTEHKKTALNPALVTNFLLSSMVKFHEAIADGSN